MKKIFAAVTTMILVGAAASACAPADTSDAICDDFAHFVHDGQLVEERDDVVASIGSRIDKADPMLQDNYQALVRTVDANDSTWKLAADVFAQTCFDTGWEG